MQIVASPLSATETAKDSMMAADSFSYKNHKVATESDSDSAVYNGSFGLFTGAETLWDSLKIPVPGEVTLSGSAKIESGAFKLILVSENGVETFYNADDGEDFSLVLFKRPRQILPQQKSC